MDSLINHTALKSRAFRLPWGAFSQGLFLITLITQGSLVLRVGTHVCLDADLMLEAEHPVGIYTG